MRLRNHRFSSRRWYGIPSPMTGGVLLLAPVDVVVERSSLPMRPKHDDTRRAATLEGSAADGATWSDYSMTSAGPAGLVLLHLCCAGTLASVHTLMLPVTLAHSPAYLRMLVTP